MLTHLNCNSFLLSSLFIGFGGGVSAQELDLDILTGHYEMQIDYTESNGFETVSYTHLTLPTTPYV